MDFSDEHRKLAERLLVVINALEDIDFDPSKMKNLSEVKARRPGFSWSDPCIELPNMFITPNELVTALVATEEHNDTGYIHRRYFPHIVATKFSPVVQRARTLDKNKKVRQLVLAAIANGGVIPEKIADNNVTQKAAESKRSYDFLTHRNNRNITLAGPHIPSDIPAIRKKPGSSDFG